MTCALLALHLGDEFIGWAWSFWDRDDEPQPVPLLTASWPAWLKLDGGRVWLRYRLWLPVRWWLESSFPKVLRPWEPPPAPIDKDGRTPEEWLLIYIIGVWNLEWFEGEYDKRVKKNWDEFLAAQCTAAGEKGTPDRQPGSPD
jgi:hypothetical protein